MPREPKTARIVRVRRSRILELLAAGPITFKDVIAACDCDYRQAWAGLRRIHKEVPKPIYVKAWLAPAHGKPFPQFALGDQEDAPRPRALTDSEKSAAWRARTHWGRSVEQINKQLEARLAVVHERYAREIQQLEDAARVARLSLTRKARRRGATPLPSGPLSTLTQLRLATEAV